MIKDNFSIKWEEWDAPIEYVEWTCPCGHVNSGKSTTCSKCKQKLK